MRKGVLAKTLRTSVSVLAEDVAHGVGDLAQRRARLDRGDDARKQVLGPFRGLLHVRDRPGRRAVVAIGPEPLQPRHLLLLERRVDAHGLEGRLLRGALVYAD